MRNLQGMDKIPENYQWAILEYLVQTSRALAHAHKFGLVHGKFCLSKVLVHTTDFGTRETAQVREPKEKNKCNHYFALNDPVLASTIRHTIVITNFEPMAVEKIMEERTGKGGRFSEIFKAKGLKLEYEDYLKIAKLMDLEAFGNSLIELLQGKYIEGAEQYGEKHTGLESTKRRDMIKSIIKAAKNVNAKESPNKPEDDKTKAKDAKKGTKPGHTLPID